MPWTTRAPLFAVLLAGCAPREPPPPTERLVEVTSIEAPLLHEIEDDENAAEVGHKGDLLYVVKPLPPLAWKGVIAPSTKAERNGPMAELRATPAGGISYGFR